MSCIIEYNQVAVENVKCVRCIVPFVMAVLDGNVFEITYGVE